MMVLTDKPEVSRTDAALLVEELTGIYSMPAPKGWHGAERSKLYFIDWISFTIAGVQYLYPEPKHESYSCTTNYNLWYKTKHS